MLKARHVDKNSDTPGDDNSLSEIFDESALLIGGKISDNIGGSFEVANGANDVVQAVDVNGTTVPGSYVSEGSGLGFSGKLTFTKPFSIGRLGITLFNTDALGVFSGTEIYSSGLFRPIRQFENRNKTNILQKTGVGNGSASGAQAYYYGHGLYATAGQYVPGYGQSIDVETEGYKTFARAAYEFNLADFTIAAGGYYIGGDVINPVAQGQLVGVVWTTDANSLDRKSNGLDMQIEGAVSGMSLMVTGAIVLNNEYTEGGIIGASKMEDTGYSFDAQLNILKDIGVKVAYLSSEFKDKTLNLTDDQSIISGGVEYNAAQNVRFVLEYSHTKYSGSENTPANSNRDTDGDLLLMAMVAF
ncbi:hypothetical protein [Sulfurimonas sp.]|uniref:hypothetical protein n=1 Tax=Sulfurimonas sp. TaxID=2022749 RepID=UPI00260352A8|nr:hypothetical protein [Sulfurimonas sp.]MCW8895224.1 hypothetical protein [Sulfurimonas sp.]MCW9068263.1 hypothetical protein [Sulfurimonas sp.]